MIKLTEKLPMLVTLFLTSIIGFIGYIIFKYIRMPAPALTGSLVANAIVTSLSVNWSEMPTSIVVLLQIMIGIMIGIQFDKEKIKMIKILAIPSLLVALWMVLFGLFLGYIILKLTSLDVGTALFSAAPGGIVEMSVLAMDYDLDASKVVLFQFQRVVSIYFIVPFMVSYIRKRTSSDKMHSSSKKQKTKKVLKMSTI